MSNQGAYLPVILIIKSFLNLKETQFLIGKTKSRKIFSTILEIFLKELVNMVPDLG